MKNLSFLSNKLKFKFLAIILLGAFTLVTSCKDEEESPFEDVTVQFVVAYSPDVVLKAVVTQVGVEQSQNFDVAANIVFVTPPRIVNTSAGALHIASTATGLDPDSELTVKILVNGKIKSEETVIGLGNLVVKADYNFIE